jgi:hypothetical protein
MSGGLNGFIEERYVLEIQQSIRIWNICFKSREINASQRCSYQSCSYHGSLNADRREAECGPLQR